MRRITAVTLGALAGLFLSGILMALGVVFLPLGWRGERLVWTATAVVVMLSMWAAQSMATTTRR